MKMICITCKVDCHNAGTMARIIECSSYEPGRVLTNADRIRAMSDEELAEWLCRALDCGFCKSYLQDVSIYSCCENQVKGIFDWLQQPAEEDT